jgi:hypothetical protein
MLEIQLETARPGLVKWHRRSDTCVRAGMLARGYATERW